MPKYSSRHLPAVQCVAKMPILDLNWQLIDITAVRLKVEENQLVDVFGEIGFHIDGLKGA